MSPLNRLPSQSIVDLPPLLAAAVRRKSFATLTRQVRDLLDSLHPGVPEERRRYRRAAIPFLFKLTPLDADGLPLPEETITVVGKDLSTRGLSFFHEHPLSFRRAVVLLEPPEAPPFAAEIDIRWCRFAKVGWYESGSRLVRAIETRSPLA